MPGPPPPPPAAPPPPMMPPPAKGMPDDRGALLKSIRQGTKLKKTVTVDKSAPMIPGKVTSNNSTSNNTTTNTSTSNSTPVSNGMGLGGLFAGGMPKLRPTGRQLGGAESSNDGGSALTTTNNALNQRNWRQKSPDVPTQPQNNFHNIQSQLKKQLANESSKQRGPPPPAPTRTISEEVVHSKTKVELKNGSVTNVQHQTQSTTSLNTLHLNTSGLQANASTLHRKAMSNINISNVDASTNNNKPTISHGKPNLAPKPPSNGKPAAPPKKLILNGKPVGRAQSMKSPRSPSPQSPDNNNLSPVAKFGTVRNLTTVIGNSLQQHQQVQQRQRPALNMRPNAPPPSVPVGKTPVAAASVMRPPNHAPPPPPPHKTHVVPQVPSRAPPAIPTNNGCAPPPPPRHSSIRPDNGSTATTKRIAQSPSDLDVRFSECFHSPAEFPRPAAFKKVYKVYSSKSVGGKQQAPQPPQPRQWDGQQAC